MQSTVSGVDDLSAAPSTVWRAYIFKLKSGFRASTVSTPSKDKIPLHVSIKSLLRRSNGGIIHLVSECTRDFSQLYLPCRRMTPRLSPGDPCIPLCTSVVCKIRCRQIKCRRRSVRVPTSQSVNSQPDDSRLRLEGLSDFSILDAESTPGTSSQQLVRKMQSRLLLSKLITVCIPMELRRTVPFCSKRVAFRDERGHLLIQRGHLAQDPCDAEIAKALNQLFLTSAARRADPICIGCSSAFAFVQCRCPRHRES